MLQFHTTKHLQTSTVHAPNSSIKRTTKNSLSEFLSWQNCKAWPSPFTPAIVSPTFPFPLLRFPNSSHPSPFSIAKRSSQIQLYTEVYRSAVSSFSGVRGSRARPPTHFWGPGNAFGSSNSGLLSSAEVKISNVRATGSTTAQKCHLQRESVRWNSNASKRECHAKCVRLDRFALCNFTFEVVTILTKQMPE